MTNALWKSSAIELTRAIAAREASAREAVQSVLERISQVNPRVNALTDVLTQDALAAAASADQRQSAGQPLGPLHGVPITVKVNVDTAGLATTDGVVALHGHRATTDSPLVSALRDAGAVIVGRTNTPAFSLRWFTDNDLHGRTLNPFDSAVTPGGSSGGAAVAVATGMGPIAHGNDYGGSIRYPAWACGVVGLRPTVGRIPSYKESAQSERGISSQLMSVQGPLARTVADAGLAMQVMSRGSALDPGWVPAPWQFLDAGKPFKVALFKQHAAYCADASVVSALEQAARWLVQAGCEVEEAQPPHFEEAAELWRTLVYDDLRRGGLAAIETFGDAAVRANLRLTLEGRPALDRDAYLDALARRLTICRNWALFFERYPVVLMPNSWERQFAVDSDTVSLDRMNHVIAAQSPLLGTAMLGLPGLSVPTGVDAGLPTGVQLVSWRFREDLLLRAGQVLEDAAGYSVLDHVAA